VKKLTVKEIAKMAEVSVTAVSFVLNNKPGVSDETRKRVQKIIDETGFRPNLNSKKLLMNKSFNICLMVNAFSSPFEDLFYFEVTRGILSQSQKYGYTITIANLPASRTELPDIVYSGDTDGIIFMQDVPPKLMDKAIACGIPCVVVDSHLGGDKIPSVAPDYRRATEDATEYLIRRGHEKIAIITSETVPDFYTQTLAGFKETMKTHSLPINPAFCGMTATGEETAYRAARNLLSREDRPTAIVCTVDSFAIGAMLCAKDLALSLPRDVSFIGIDDILLSRYIEPKLTTIGIDKVEMGAMATDMLLQKIRGKNPESRLLPMTLIERDSVYTLKE